jgi:hypothetical protein
MVRPRLADDPAVPREDAPDGARRARQDLAPRRQVRITVEVVQDGLRSRYPPQALGRLVAHLQDAGDHRITVSDQV